MLQVLCELQMAMLERGIEVEDDVDRSIMGKDVRNTEDSSYRNLRDWYDFLFLWFLLLLFNFFYFSIFFIFSLSLSSAGISTVTT